ncbi:MAG: hypothetical protein LBH16_02815 [Treponema sp.]|nr:hypothetical protein [Treponema sp.]
MNDVYAAIGASKQEISWWKNHLTSAQTKKNHKYDVIRSAGKLFALSEDETESLANKAGLSLKSDKGFTGHLRGLIEKKGSLFFELHNKAQVSERMFQYIKKGKLPSKETLIALSVPMGIGINGIQELLKKAGYVLSNSLPNDAIIMWMLKNSSNNAKCLHDINFVLYDFDLPLLMTREKVSKSQ